MLTGLGPAEKMLILLVQILHFPSASGLLFWFCLCSVVVF